MEENIRLVKKLALICVLSTTSTESSVLSATIFNDTRTTLYSRMLESIKQKYNQLRLERFVPKQNRDSFLDWIDSELQVYSDKDMFLNPSFINNATPDTGLYWYQIEPHYSIQSLYYNLSPSIITYILQRLPFHHRVFPCRYSIYIDGNKEDLVNLIVEANKREKKNEQQKKNSND